MAPSARLPLICLMGVAAVALLCAWTVYVNWSELPEQFPTHFDLQGNVDSWAPTSLGIVVFLPLTSFLICGWMALLGLVLAKPHPELPAWAAQLQVRSANLFAALGMGLSALLTLLFMSTVQVALGHEPVNEKPILPGLVIYAFLALIFGIRLASSARREIREAREEGEGPFRFDDRRPWKLGILYFDPEDPMLVIPQRIGFGITFNLGHARARRMMWVLLGIVIVIPVHAALVFSD